VKVFCDANFWVSHILWGGAPTKALRATLAAGWRLLVTEDLLEEVGDVLRRKFDCESRFVASNLQRIAQVSRLIVTGVPKYQIEADPDDTLILAAALSGGADFLVTRDKHLLTLGRVESLRVITLAEYLELLRDRGFPAPT
jgi:putative PIN family toxin of toxin-antitoxin system